FGEKKTLFLIHYRNISGGLYSFRETLPDEGDMDFYLVMKALRDVGYTYGVDPDHLPSVPGDPQSGRQSYAYGFGYIKAMIQAVYGEE
ncbi:MAG: mannonate dehydratase, partial [Candidatus Latescibacterota bacterium]